MSSFPEQGIDAIILAGGLGTRLKGTIGDLPKPMAEVAGRPFLEWLIRYLKLQGCTRVVLAVGYKAELIQEYFKNHDLGIEIEFSIEDRPLGTGGALLLALSKVQRSPVLVLNGDSYCAFDLKRLYECHKSKKQCATFWLTKVDDRSRFGLVNVASDGRIESFNEKDGVKAIGLINAGVYLMETSMLGNLQIDPDQSVSLEKHVFPLLLKKGVHSVVGTGPFLDIGIPDDYLRAEHFLKKEFLKL